MEGSSVTDYTCCTKKWNSFSAESPANYYAIICCSDLLHEFEKFLTIESTLGILSGRVWVFLILSEKLAHSLPFYNVVILSHKSQRKEYSREFS